MGLKTLKIIQFLKITNTKLLHYFKGKNKFIKIRNIKNYLNKEADQFK